MNSGKDILHLIWAHVQSEMMSDEETPHAAEEYESNPIDCLHAGPCLPRFIHSVTWAGGKTALGIRYLT